MNICSFGPFRFDRQLLKLSRGNQELRLRPKSAMLLSKLLERPGETLAKADLAAKVWNRRLVQDQTLFQTMSELRRVLAPHQVIVTVPNVGYRFVMPVMDRSGSNFVWQKSVRQARVAALIAIAVVGGSAAPEMHKPGPAVHTAPAIQAFYMGMTHLDQPARAQRYFELASRENGSFLEAQLMLSEALLSQGRHGQARHTAERLLNLAEQKNLSYLRASAMDLLSRISETTGAADLALDWAVKARDTAQASGFACTAEQSSQRVVALSKPEVLPSSPIPGETQSGEKPSGVDEQQFAGYESGLVADTEYCREIYSDPGEPDDLSQCMPSESGPVSSKKTDFPGMGQGIGQGMGRTSLLA